MNLLTSYKNKNYQTFEFVNSIERPEVNSNPSSVSSAIYSNTTHAIHALTTTQDNIIPLPSEITAIVAEYCQSRHFNSILSPEVRNKFYYNFKQILLTDIKIIRVVNEIDCFYLSENNETFCLETIDKIRKFAGESDTFIKSMKEIGQRFRLVSCTVSPDLDIFPTVEKIKKRIDIDLWQFWILLCSKGYLKAGNIEDNEDVKDILEFLKNPFWLRDLETHDIPDVTPIREWFNKPENKKILASLTHIDLSIDNHAFCLTTFPSVILKMKNLVHVTFCRNNIQYVPQEIHQLKFLKDLRMVPDVLLIPDIRPPFVKDLKRKYNIFYAST